MLAFYTQSQTFVISALNLGDQVGLFTALFGLFAVTQMACQIVNTAIAPAIFKAADNTEKILTGYKLVIRFFLTGALFIMAGSCYDDIRSGCGFSLLRYFTIKCDLCKAHGEIHV